MAQRHRGERRDYVQALGALFARVGVWSFDHRWIVLTICIVLLAFSALVAARARFDNSLEAYFAKTDPAYVTYLDYRRDFGSDELSYIVYEAPGVRYGPWNLEVMRKIAHLTAALEKEVPFVREVTSLSNVEFMDPIPDGIRVYDLLEEFPESQEELLAIRDKVVAKPMYLNNLVSPDGRRAAITLEMTKSSTDPLEEIRLDPDGGDALANLYPQATHAVIEEILARPEYQGITFHHVGDVPLNAIYNQIVATESGVLGAATFGVIAVLLLVFLRSPIGVLGPLSIVALSIMVSMGFVGLMGWKLDLTFIMLPNLLIAVGVADAVHIISEYRTYQVELGDRREAARRSLTLLGPPCLLTSLTTAAGFVAMSVAPIKAIAHFAVYSAVGVVAAFLLSVTLLLVFLSFGGRIPALGATAAERLRAKGGARMQSGLATVASFVIRRRRRILAVAAVVFALSMAGVAQLRVDSVFLHEFGASEPVRVATEYVDELMGGTASIVYLFDAGEDGGTKEPAVLREIERFQGQADVESPIVRKTTSLVDLLKDINQTFHDGDPAYAAVPETRDLAAQYLLVYEMSGGDELRDYVSMDLARTNLEIRAKSAASSEFWELIGGLDGYLAGQPVEASDVTLTGMGALWLRLMEYITWSQIRGFLFAFTVIAALLCFIFRSVKIGLIAMVPNLAPVILTLGVMGWTDLPLDYIRLLIASVAIGLSVDDTIHLVTRIVHEFRKRGNYEQAFRAAMADVGRALFVTSVVLVCGFLVLLLSTMDSLSRFGALLAGTVVTALVADFLVLPALILTLKPLGPERDESERMWSDATASGGGLGLTQGTTGRDTGSAVSRAPGS